MKGINGGSQEVDGRRNGNKRRVLLDVAYPFPRQWLEVSTKRKRIDYFLFRVPNLFQQKDQHGQNGIFLLSLLRARLRL